MSKPIPIDYLPTPTMREINQMLGDTRCQALAIWNFGDFPFPKMIYRNRPCRLKEFSLNLSLYGESFMLSQDSPPTYFFAMAQEKEDQPIYVILYLGEDQHPVLEYTGGEPLTGHFMAYSGSSDQRDSIVAHGLFSPIRSHVFTSVNRPFSVTFEKAPELCAHLRMCGDMISRLMNQVSGARITVGSEITQEKNMNAVHGPNQALEKGQNKTARRLPGWATQSDQKRRT